MASPPRDTQYTPAIPSRLNPICLQLTPPRQQRRGNHSRRAASAKPSGVPVSPTHRLMRQKAIAAWKSLASADHAIHGATAQTVTRGFQPEIVDVVSKLPRRQSFAIIRASPGQGSANGEDRAGELLSYNTFDGFDKAHSDPGLAPVDMEKQSLLRHRDFDTILASISPAAVPVYEPRPRCRKILTQSRVLLAASILCIIGALSACLTIQAEI